MTSASGPDRSLRWKRALPCLLIAGVSALAHLWCLGSQFFLDDVLAIRDSSYLHEGEWWKPGLSAWTYFWYWVQFKLWGTSPVGFHAVNWLLHTAVGIVLYRFGRDAIPLEKPDRVALAAALVFVAHPLASEIPNYARTQDIAWVTLFSLTASWAALRAVRDADWRWLVALLAGVLGATFSKGPGLGHALMMVGLVLAGCAPRETWALLRKRGFLLLGGLAVLALVAWLSGALDVAIAKTVRRWNAESMFGWHAVTLCRVFWMFCARVVFPDNLSADHFIPMTISWEDPQAMPALIGLVLWMLVSTIMLFRKRTRFFGMCLWLFGGTIAFRVLYVINEFMPEYRIYPGLPWICLGVVVLGAAAWRRMTEVSPAGLVGLLLAVLCVTSAVRSFKWHSLDTLCADVLEQYPYQTRALWMLQRRDVPAGRYDKAIKRFQDLQAGNAAFRAEQQRIAPGRRLSVGHNAMSDIACAGYVAESLAALGREAQARALLKQMENNLIRAKISREGSGRMLWDLQAIAKARVLEQLGEYEEALAQFEGMGRMHYRWVDRDRIEKKLAARGIAGEE